MEHSPAARAELHEFALTTATLLNIRVIIDYVHFTMPFTIAFVRSPMGFSGISAYVHCQSKKEWLPDEAAWIELFSQLWPGY